MIEDDDNAKRFIIQVPLEENIGEEQKGTIKVGSQILTQLSKGVYSNPEMALKELISNAYDADASTVTIETKSSGNALIIHDDGKGMDYKDFDEKFAYISKSPKVDEGELSKKFKRPIIGRLGIGFIAVSALCNTMIVSATTEKSDTKFVAVLDFKKFKEKKSKDLDFYEISEYRIKIYKKEKNEKPYTHIELRDLEIPFRNILINKPKRGAKTKNFRNPKFEEIITKMWKTKSLFEIGKEYGPYWQFVTNLASIIPVEYLDDGPVNDNRFKSIINPIRKLTSDLKFKVLFDEMELRKPYLFPTIHGQESQNYDVLSLDDKISVPGRGDIEYVGYVYSQDGGINIDDWRGLIVRVKNTSIGIKSQNFLDYPGLSDSLYFKWTFGEIYVTKGLEEAMNIDRATFKLSDPEYGAFVDSLHKKLQKSVFESVQKRWRARVKKQQADVEGYKEKWRRRSMASTFNNKKFEIKPSKNIEFPVSFSADDDTILIDPKHELLEKFPRKEAAFLKDILLAVTLSRERYPTNPKMQERHLFQLLNDLASKYPKPGLKYEKIKK